MSNIRLIPGLFLVTLGVAALLRINLWDYVWPAILIFLGLRIIARDNSFDGMGSPVVSKESDLNEVRIFSGINKKVANKKFKGGKIVVMFGGGELDLREAESDEKEISLEVVALFGGLKVRLPKDWEVKSNGVGIVGGYDNKTEKSGEGSVRLLVEGAALFGGVELTDD